MNSGHIMSKLYSMLKERRELVRALLNFAETIQNFFINILVFVVHCEGIPFHTNDPVQSN